MNSPAESATTGVLLKEGRQQAGLSIREIAERTRIRRTYLEALEADRFDLLPGDVYALGFTRLYAEAVGLEAAPLLAQIRRQMAAGCERVEHAGRGGGGALAVLRWVLLALIVIGVAVGLVYREWHIGPHEEKPSTSVAQEAPIFAQDKESDGEGSVVVIETGDDPKEQR
jgi:cytoskeleton protein RodZ